MSVGDKDKDVVSNRERGGEIWDACKSDFPTKCRR